MTFIWPIMLISLLLIPIFIDGYFRLFKRRQRAAAEFGPLSIIQSTTGNLPGRTRHVPPFFFSLGLTFLFFGLARPEMHLDLPRVEGTVILAFDVSNSMAAEDLDPTRMEAAKEAARTFVNNQPETVEIGVVAFSNGGLIVQPPTDDQAAVLATIERLSPQGATSLGQGIFSSLNAIIGEPIPINPDSLEEGVLQIEIDNYSSAVILMLTDGEDTTSLDPLTVAQLAAQAGIRIYPVGIGSPEGTVLEIEGFNIVTTLNETLLMEIASLTNGTYYHAPDAETLQTIYDELDLQLTLSGEKMEVTAIFAGLSIIFFLIGAALSLRWFGRMPL